MTAVATDALEERILRRIPVEVAALSEKGGALRSGIGLYALRLGLICAVFSLIILVFPGKILAFAAGFSAIVPVALFEGLRGFFLLRTWKD
jgi:hypothetical protein